MTALLLAALLAPQTLYATDDVWVYPHATDQVDDPSLLAWGDGVDSVGDPSSSMFSYSIVRFDVSGVSGDVTKLKKATLLLFHDADAGFSAGDSKAAPLEARLVDAAFDEKKWMYNDYSKHFPEAGEKSLLGRASPAPGTDGKPFKVEIDLLSGKADFRKALSGKKAVAIALSTRMAPSGEGGPYYRILSRSNDKALQPRLVLEFD
jgi:hypothetical protein